MATALPTRQEEYLREDIAFKENAFNIIKKMQNLCNLLKTPESILLVDEILHSIFFLGQVKNNSHYTPNEIIGDQDILAALKEIYPRPFELFLTQLPKRSPFSCVMDMVVQQKGQENEDQIKQSLREILGELKPIFLVSTKICVSQPPNLPVRYYGVSISANYKNPRNIVVAAACLSNWDDYVAGAVMTYYPKMVPNGYFDGTIKLPQGVRCRAFDLNTGEAKPACKSCQNLFGLQTDENQRANPYGNCAETESLSNLLKNNQAVKSQTRRESPTCTPENRQKAEQSLRDILTATLRSLHFNWDNQNQFYTPQ